MEEKLNTLAGKVEKAALLIEQLRADNDVLKKRLAASEAEQERLLKNMKIAHDHVEALIAHIPEGAAT